MRTVNVDRMRRYMARTTPDRKLLTCAELEATRGDAQEITALLRPWMDRMAVKHPHLSITIRQMPPWGHYLAEAEETPERPPA